MIHETMMYIGRTKEKQQKKDRHNFTPSSTQKNDNEKGLRLKLEGSNVTFQERKPDIYSTLVLHNISLAERGSKVFPAFDIGNQRSP